MEEQRVLGESRWEERSGLDLNILRDPVAGRGLRHCVVAAAQDLVLLPRIERVRRFQSQEIDSAEIK